MTDKEGHGGPNSKQLLSVNEDEVVSELNQKIRESELPYYEIGKFLLDTYFHGNPEEVRDKDPTKDASFRKLAKRQDLDRSFSWLHKVLSVTIQDDLFNQKGIDVSSVPYSVKAELVSLPDDKKIPLIENAINERLSVRQVRRTVRDIKKPDDSKKLDKPKLQKSVAKLERFLAELDPWPETIALAFEAMDLEDMKSLYDAVLKGQNIVKELEGKFSDLRQGLEDNMPAAAAREREAVEASQQSAQEGADPQ